MIHAERIHQQRSEITEKSVTILADNRSRLTTDNLAVRRRMAEELVERGLSREAADRLMRVDKV